MYKDDPRYIKAYNEYIGPGHYEDAGGPEALYEQRRKAIQVMHDVEVEYQHLGQSSSSHDL